MNNIQDFIITAAGQLGADPGKLEGATAGLLGLIQKDADGGRDLVKALPGADSLLATAGGGGGLLGMAGKLLGGNIGQGLGAAGLLKSAGLDQDRGGQFLSLFVAFARSHAGQELVGRVLQSFPQLAKLLG
ncbi:MAG: hypothetical protein R3D98_09280 [Candidatus Krumholzibacteriia bacterium]